MGRSDQASNDLPRQITLEPAPFCGSCSANVYCSAIRSATACRAENFRAGLAHPLDPYLLNRIREANGWSFADIVALPIHPLRLPPYVPVVEPRGLGSRLELPILAVTLKDAFHVSGSARRALTLRSRLGVNAHSKVILLCTGNDHLLGAALDGGLDNLVRSVKRGRFDLVSALATSHYRTEAAMENLLSMKESLVSLQSMQRQGITAFPMISFGNLRDVERFAEWCHNNPCVRLVGIDMQDARNPSEKRFFMEGFRCLVKLCPPDLHYVLKGPASERAIRRVFSVTPRITIANEQPFMKATRGGRQNPGLTSAQIFLKLAQRQVKYCREARAAFQVSDS